MRGLGRRSGKYEVNLRAKSPRLSKSRIRKSRDKSRSGKMESKGMQERPILINFERKEAPEYVNNLKSRSRIVRRSIETEPKKSQGLIEQTLSGIAGGITGLFRRLTSGQLRVEERDNRVSSKPKSRTQPLMRVRSVGGRQLDRSHMFESQLVDLETGRCDKRSSNEVDLSYYNQDRHLASEVRFLSQQDRRTRDKRMSGNISTIDNLNQSCHPEMLRALNKGGRRSNKSMNVRRMFIYQIDYYDSLTRSRADSIKLIKEKRDNCIKPVFSRNKGFSIVSSGDDIKENILDNLRESLFELNKHDSLKREEPDIEDDDEEEEIFRKKRKRGKKNRGNGKLAKWRSSQIMINKKKNRRSQRFDDNLSSEEENSISSSDKALKDLDQKIRMSLMYNDLDGKEQKEKEFSEVKKKFRDASTSVRKVEKSIQTCDINKGGASLNCEDHSFKTATFAEDSSWRNTFGYNSVKEGEGKTHENKLRQTIGVEITNRKKGLFESQESRKKPQGEFNAIQEVNEKKEEERKESSDEKPKEEDGNVFFSVAGKDGEEAPKGTSLFFNNDKEEKGQEKEDDDKGQERESGGKEDKVEEAAEKVVEGDDQVVGGKGDEEVKPEGKDTEEEKEEEEEQKTQNFFTIPVKTSKDSKKAKEGDQEEANIEETQKENSKQKNNTEQPDVDKEGIANPFISFVSADASSLFDKNFEGKSNNLFGDNHQSDQEEKSMFFNANQKPSKNVERDNKRDSGNSMMSLINKKGKSTMFEEENGSNSLFANENDRGGAGLFNDRSERAPGLFGDFQSKGSPGRAERGGRGLFGGTGNGIFNNNDRDSPRDSRRNDSRRGGFFNSGDKSSTNPFMDSRRDSDRDRRRAGGGGGMFGEQNRDSGGGFFDSNDDRRETSRLFDQDRGSRSNANPFTSVGSTGGRHRDRDREVSFGGFSRGGESSNPFLAANKRGGGSGGLFDTTNETGFGNNGGRTRKIKRIIRPDTQGDTRLFD